MEVAQMADTAGGWHFRDVLSAASLVYSVIVVGLLGLVFRAGKVFQEYVETLQVVRSIKTDLKELRAEWEEQRERAETLGRERDAAREALRLELKADIAAVHRRMDEALKR
jgi:hypothetical protein